MRTTGAQRPLPPPGGVGRAGGVGEEAPRTTSTATQCGQLRADARCRATRRGGRRSDTSRVVRRRRVVDAKPQRTTQRPRPTRRRAQASAAPTGADARRRRGPPRRRVRILRRTPRRGRRLAALGGGGARGSSVCTRGAHTYHLAHVGCGSTTPAPRLHRATSIAADVDASAESGTRMPNSAVRAQTAGTRPPTVHARGVASQLLV